ncbi:Uncharacterised protein [Mycobacteroides abscessus subsp. massiliense]|nr:Uncharacterised protein [Mycobacteroides abscessus subsp. massiliense]
MRLSGESGKVCMLSMLWWLLLSTTMRQVCNIWVWLWILVEAVMAVFLVS